MFLNVRHDRESYLRLKVIAAHGKAYSALLVNQPLVFKIAIAD